MLAVIHLLFTAGHAAPSGGTLVRGELVDQAMALSMSSGLETALAEIEALERGAALSGYHYLYAVKAELLGRLGRSADAADAYRLALGLAGNDAERAFLADQLRRYDSVPRRRGTRRELADE